MGGSKGKTGGDVNVKGNINDKGVNVNAEGRINHNTGNGTEIYVKGDINRNQPYHGKGNTNGNVEIGIKKDF